MNGLTLRHLRAVAALALHGHFGRAAGACAISQPALSVRVQELEALLGAALVERGGGRRVRLTPLGEQVAARAQDILRAVEDLGDLARAPSGALTGRLHLGLIPTVAPYLLPALARTLVQAHPGLELRPREARTSRLIGDLLAGDLDAAILALPVSEPALHEHPLFEEEFVLVRPAADAGRPVPNPRRLRTMRLLLLEDGHCFRDQALAVCGLAGEAPRDLMEGSSLTTLVQMVGAGLGITLIPAMAVALETRSADVSVAAFPEPRPRRRIGLVWRRSSPLAGPLRALADLVHAAATP